LAWGTISLRSVFSQLELKRNELGEEKGRTSWNRSLRAFESRLYWRDHFIQRLESVSDMEVRVLNRAYENLEYEDNLDHLESWLAGKTGYPMVDACMRCLNETGFMNFRMRAMLVSFACFGLHLSWRTIHQPLARLFTDYEPGIHLSQIQMQAGVIGINALRVYSPSKQFLDHDPAAQFVKRWVPELADRTPAEIAHAEECNIPEYIRPIVNQSVRSKKMKDQIYLIRKSDEGRFQSSKTLQSHGSQKKISRKRKPKNNGQLELF
jgi:deoxyribodipyrimidine photo-lyase